MRFTKPIFALVAAFMFASLFATEAASQNTSELPCATGSVDLLAPTYNSSTQKTRSWVCVDPFGHVTSPVFSSGGGGVTSFNTRSGVVVPILADYQSLLWTGNSTLTAPFQVTDSLGNGFDNTQGLFNVFAGPSSGGLQFGDDGLGSGDTITMSNGTNIGGINGSDIVVDESCNTGNQCIGLSTSGQVTFSGTNITLGPTGNVSVPTGGGYFINSVNIFAAPPAIGSVTPNVGNFTLEKLSTAQTTVNCSTSGSVVFSEPEQGSSYKVIQIYANACLGTASFTYTIPFTHTPQVLSQTLAALVSSNSTTACTITGTTSTGFIMLNGF